MRGSRHSIVLKAALAAFGWLALTASVSREPLMPQGGRVPVFGQGAYFDPKEAEEEQPFGRYPRLDADTFIEPWHFKAVGNAYELGTFNGKVWEYKLTFAFRHLPGYPTVLIGQYAVDPKLLPKKSDRDFDEDYLPRYFVLHYARNGDFIGYRDFMFSEEHCTVIGKARLARMGMKPKDMGSCHVQTWRQVEMLAKAYLRSRPSPLGVLHRIDRKTAEASRD